MDITFQEQVIALIKDAIANFDATSVTVKSIRKGDFSATYVRLEELLDILKIEEDKLMYSQYGKVVHCMKGVCR